MGEWGRGIFDDDTSADLRADYRELLKDQVPDDDATRRVLEIYEDDHELTAVIALAAAQFEFGRLDDDIKKRALAIIASGALLDQLRAEWRLYSEEDEDDLFEEEQYISEHAAVLDELRAALDGEQRPRKTMRKTWRYQTDLREGDVLAFTDGDGDTWVYWVVRIEDDGRTRLPILQSVSWWFPHIPGVNELPGLRSMPILARTHRLTRFIKEHPDWMNVGFQRLGRVTIPPRKKRSRVWLDSTWPELRALHPERKKKPAAE